MVRNEDFNKAIICSRTLKPVLKSYIDGVIYEIRESEGIYRFNHDRTTPSGTQIPTRAAAAESA